MARARNVANASALGRVFRGNFESLSLADFEGELDSVCGRHEGFLTDVYRTTRRPLARILAQAIAEAWPANADSLAIATRLVEVTTILRQKGQNTKDGSRSTKPVANLLKALLEPFP